MQEIPVADFDADTRIAAAVAEAGSDDFGDAGFTDDVRAYLHAIATEADISPLGGLRLQHLVHGLLVNRLATTPTSPRTPRSRSRTSATR